MIFWQMKGAMEAELKEAGLQNITHTYTKVLQLYETKNSRHSVMIVGSTLSGKTVSWRILQAALTRLSKEGDPNFLQVKVGIGVLNFPLWQYLLSPMGDNDICTI